jgi:lambda repressor-like predicted transcriptional regulator
MHEVIQEMVNRGWSLTLISSRSGVSQNRLERGVFGVKEEKALMRLAEEECGIDLDDLELNQ